MKPFSVSSSLDKLVSYLEQTQQQVNNNTDVEIQEDRNAQHFRIPSKCIEQGCTYNNQKPR